MGKEPRRQRAHVADVLILCGYQRGGDQLAPSLMWCRVLKTVEAATLPCSHRRCATFQCSGWLAEASGIEHLLQQVVALQRSGVIEVRRQGQPWLWLFSERVQPWSPPLESEPARLPYTLRFAHPEAPAPVIMPTMEAAIVQTPLAALSEQVTDTLLAALQTRSLIMQQWAKAPSCCMTSIHHVISDVHQLTRGLASHIAGK